VGGRLIIWEYRMTRAAAVWLVLGLRLGFAPAAVQADDWSQWRGSARDGTWSNERITDHLLGKSLTPRWRQPIGGGYAGIAVVGDRVYTLDRQAKPHERERILCLDATTGRSLWIHEYAAPYHKMDYGNGPRSTPTVHSGRVYTMGAVGHLLCLDDDTGRVVWSRDTAKDFQGRIPTWGHACSPLVDGKRLIVQVGGQPNACLVAFDAATGKECWRSLADRPGYSSPILIGPPTGRQIVCWTAENVVGLDPDTGQVRWRVPYVSTYDVAISDPVWHRGILLVSGYWEGAKAIQLDRHGLHPNVLWQGKQLSCLMSTPLSRDGFVYALDRREGLECVDLATGQVKWKGVHVTPKGRNPQATLVWAGDTKGRRALILNELGELILARLTPESYRELGRAALIPGTWAHSAYAAGAVFARNDQEILCVPLLDAHPGIQSGQ
jgi:outer membrane protein assembly factor BamB